MSAVRSVDAGGSSVDAKIIDVLIYARSGAPSSQLAVLTAREREVLAEIAQGKSNSAIAESLFLTKRSVEKLVNYAQSYGLTTQLYALAIATGVLGLCTHLLFTALERRALRWHPSQRLGAA